MNKSQKVIARLYPEMGAGGFAHVDQVPLFYFRVNALLRPDMVVLDFGAGRGRVSRLQRTFLKDLMVFKGRCAKVYGADIDPIVLQNETVDEAVVMAGNRIPLPDNSVDLIVSAATFEHIANPGEVAEELRRVLRPGGWICAWTVSRFGYVALVASIVPYRLHAAVIKIVEPQGRAALDVFPTTYRLNTIRAVRRHFSNLHFENFSYYLPGIPAYNGGSMLFGWLLNFYNNMVPGPMKKNLHIFLRKR